MRVLIEGFSSLRMCSVPWVISALLLFAGKSNVWSDTRMVSPVGGQKYSTMYSEEIQEL
jgi:hypothetical protein